MYKSLRLLLGLALGCNVAAQAQTAVFTYTPTVQHYTVPAGVTGIIIDAQGAPGGQNSDPIFTPNRPGRGGCARAEMVVTPGQVLDIRVGQCGRDATTSAGGAGGWNGGGAGALGTGTLAGGGGGGASDVYYSGAAIVVGAGGGGAGINCGFDADRGGDGGAGTGEDGAGCGSAPGGGGATTLGGGSGALCPTCSGPGGNSGTISTGGDAGWAGGGGGGGYYGGGGGHWSGGGGGSNFIASPGLGVYSISNTRGCKTTCNGLVSITVSCRAGVISGSDNVCVGQTITMTESVAGGTWSTDNIAVGTIDPATGVLRGIGALPGGTWVNVIYEITPGTPGCRTTKAVLVKPLPAPISGPPSVCSEYCITLTDATAGGFWSSADVSVGTIGSATGVMCGVAAGSVDISYTDPTTSCSITRTFIVNATPPPILGVPRVCVLGTTTLSDAVAGGGWSSSDGSVATINPTTGLMTGMGAGTATISYLVGVCPRTIEATVDPLPSPITMVGGGALLACVGSTSTVTATPTGGTWTVSAGTGSATIDPSTGVITPGTPGLVTVVYTLPTSCSRTATVTINAAPPAITGAATSVCQGSTISWSEPVGGVWTSSSTAIATVSGGTTTVATITGGTSTGVATITYTHSTTTCIATRDVTVNVTPAAISGPVDVCMGSVTTYSTTPTGGTWSVFSGPGSITSTGDYTASATGTATLRYTMPGTGCFRALSVVVHPQPSAIAGTMQVCVGRSVTLTNTLAGGTWSSPDDPTLVTVAGAGTSATVTGNSAGVATISYTMPSAGACYSLAYVTVNPNPAAITGSVNALCAGECTDLEDVDGGGTWSSSLSASGSVDASTGLVCGVFAGTPIISYTLPTGCYTTYPMTINGVPSSFTPSTRNICVGAPSFTLIVTGVGSGIWSSSNTSIVTIGSTFGDVSGVAAGVADICYTTDVGACVKCESFTVNPAPAPISGPNTLCALAVATYSTTPTGGTWTATNTNLSIGASSGIATGATPGVDTIRYTVGSGCVVSKTVTVIAAPNPITGPLSICLGQSTTLISGPPSFSDGWDTCCSTGTAGVTLAGVTSATLTVTTVTGPGTITLNYTNSGCTRSAVLTINVLGTPITGTLTVCQGSTTTLSNATGPGTWTSSNTGVATVGSSSGIVTGVAPGTSVITYNYGGCSTQVTVTVNPIPTSLITPLGSLNLCPGDNVTLTASTGAGYRYQWRNPGVIAGATNATYVVSSAAAGTYFVVVTLGTCSINSPNVVVTNNPVTAGISPSGAMTVCASSVPTLNATPGGPVTYQWLFGPAGSTTPIIGATAATYVPTVAGTYSVRVTNGFGCSGISPTATFTLTPSPTATITAGGPLTFCSGSSVLLTSSTGAGYTYQWRLGGLPIAGATNSTYVATAAGSYTIRITNTVGCATTSSAIVTTVTAAPPAVIIPAGTTLICAGGSVILDAPLGPYTYVWYRGGVAITGATSASYTATTTGSYTVKLTTTTGAGCSATSAAQTVTVVPAPIISPMSATSFCWGGSVTLYASVIAAAGTVNYQWKESGVNIPGATTASYVATASGAYSCTITVGPTSGTPCTITSLVTTVTEWPLPNPIITYDGIYLHTGVSFVTYQWYKNLIAISGGGATTANCHNTGLGSYTVRVTDLHGCMSVSPAYIVTYFRPKPGDPADNTIPSGEIKVFPNPANQLLHVESAEALRLVMIGMDGKTVIDQANAVDVDLSGIADGIYLIKLYDTNGELVKTEKLVKQAN